MKSEFQVEGYWWLPKNPDDRVAGVLHYKPNETPDLKLLGDFDTNESFISKHLVSEKSISPIIIHGEDANAIKITLIVLSYGKKHLNMSSSFPLIHYKIWYCIKGIHLHSKGHNIFNKIEIELESLTHWMNWYPVRLSVPIEENRLSSSFTLSYLRVDEEPSFNIDDGFSLSIMPRAGFTNLHEEEIIVQQRYVALIKSEEDTDFFTLLEKSYWLQSFLNMATFNHNNFLALRFYSKNHFQELKNGERVLTNIELFFKQKEITDINYNTAKKRDYLFGYEDVKDIFPTLINKWFSFDEKIVPILQHLIDSIEQKTVFKSVDFLIIVQALEGYHHRFFDKEPGKEKSLESRLKNLKNYFVREILILREIDTRKTANSRNYYSHFYNKSEVEYIAVGVDLYNLTKKLRYLLICCFLHELGLENLKIKGILQKYINRG